MYQIILVFFCHTRVIVNLDNSYVIATVATYYETVCTHVQLLHNAYIPDGLHMYTYHITHTHTHKHTHTHTYIYTHIHTVPLCHDIPLSALRDPSPFTCCIPDARHSWSGSAFTNQCPSAMPTADQILLNDTLQTGTCGVFTGTVTTVTGNVVCSILSFTPTQDMNGLSIQCLDASGAVLERSNFTIEIIMAG